MLTLLFALQAQLQELSRHYPLWVDDWYRFVILRGMRLPPGFNYDTTDVLIEIPTDYPSVPPGLGDSRVYVNSGLRFYNQPLAEYRENTYPDYPTFGFGPWAWVCYRTISWDPMRDDLIGFVEMLRADLTNPPTK